MTTHDLAPALAIRGLAKTFERRAVDGLTRDLDPALRNVTRPLLVLVRHLDRSPIGQLRIHVQRRRKHVHR